MDEARTSHPGRAAAIIPARDESRTIGGVIAPLIDHPLIDEVIVVDDGSHDGTVEAALVAGARVISLPANGGKAAAMAQGVRAAQSDILFFCDGDVVGLTPEIVSRIVTPVSSGAFDMYVGIRGRRTYWVNRLLRVTPILGGERAVRRALWKEVPPTYRKNFQIEIALNYFAKQNGHRMGFTVVRGLGQVIKERKRGLWRGLWERLLMIGDILVIGGRLYLLRRFRAPAISVGEQQTR